MQKSNYILSPCVLIVLLSLAESGFRLEAAAGQGREWHGEEVGVDQVHYIHSNSTNACAGCCSLGSTSGKRASSNWQSEWVTDFLTHHILLCPVFGSVCVCVSVNNIILFEIYKCELVFWFSANEQRIIWFINVGLSRWCWTKGSTIRGVNHRPCPAVPTNNHWTRVSALVTVIAHSQLNRICCSFCSLEVLQLNQSNPNSWPEWRLGRIQSRRIFRY